MHRDDFIDDIARRMTTANAAPGAMRARVRAAIDTPSQGPVLSGRAAQATLGLVGALVVLLVIVALPERSANQDVARATVVKRDVHLARPVASRGRLLPALEEPGPVAAGTTPVGASQGVRAATRAAPTTSVVGTAASVRAATRGTAGTPLPPLPHPDPVVIETLAVDRLEIAPLAIDAIQLTAIAIPPLGPPARGGV